MLRPSFALLALTVQHAAASPKAPRVYPQGASPLAVLGIDDSYLIYFEAALAILTALFVVNIAVGFRLNAALATRFASSILPLARANFAHVGVDAEGTRLLKDGACEAYFYASGRTRTTGLTAALSLRSRQDLLAVISRLVQSSVADRCTLTLPIAAEVAMEPIALLLIRAKELERLRNSYDLRTTACVKGVEDMAGHVRDVKTLPGGFVVLADHDGVVSAVLNTAVRGLLMPVAKRLHSVQVTDSGKGWDMYAEAAGPRYVRIVFDLPTGGGQEEMDEVVRPLVEVALALVDMSGNLSLSKVTRAKAVQLRKRILAEKEKERLAKRKDELEEEKEIKKKAEAEAEARRVAGDPGKQARALEKLRKKELKQRMKKATRK